DGDDVVVKDTGVDCGGELLRERAVCRIDPVTARERCRGFARLPRRILLRRGRCRVERGAPVDEELDAARAGARSEAREIRRPFVTELGCGRQRIVYGEMLRVGEDRAE